MLLYIICLSLFAIGSLVSTWYITRVDCNSDYFQFWGALITSILSMSIFFINYLGTIWSRPGDAQIIGFLAGFVVYPAGFIVSYVLITIVLSIYKGFQNVFSFLFSGISGKKQRSNFVGNNIELSDLFIKALTHPVVNNNNVLQTKVATIASSLKNIIDGNNGKICVAVEVMKSLCDLLDKGIGNSNFDFYRPLDELVQEIDKINKSISKENKSKMDTELYVLKEKIKVLE